MCGSCVNIKAAQNHHNINLEIPVGKFVAIVGDSGSGKSTVLALLERFYDPTYGRITLDGQDIRDLHLNSYRQIISLVSQEPAVFSGTSRENLMIG
ncbi:Multidrug resistance protein [Pyrenophora teres f. teres]|uniref:Multidrug resistance protein n=1 Tax=Pyrenophora teres f. teres TaxID=97479 RepID=A0A6S6VWD7_9PLEO|nr:Multidrug resistance protein [Pyrenophora teres f. teres]